MSTYYNEAGEPLMTASAATLEAELDDMAAYEPMDAADYEADYGARDAFWEGLGEQQEDGACPACGEYDCTLPMSAEFDRYTERMEVFHK